MSGKVELQLLHMFAILPILIQTLNTGTSTRIFRITWSVGGLGILRFQSMEFPDSQKKVGSVAYNHPIGKDLPGI